MILTYHVNIQIHVYNIKAPEQVFCRVLVARSLALSVLILNYASVKSNIQAITKHAHSTISFI
jgi:hypothetical protein